MIWTILCNWNFKYFQRKKLWAVKSLKFCTLMGSFCPNHIKCQLKKYSKLPIMTLKSDAKFKEKLASVFKHEGRDLVNFHLPTQRFENSASMCSFLCKVPNILGVIFYDTEHWCKIRINSGLVVSKMAWGIGWS